MNPSTPESLCDNCDWTGLPQVTLRQIPDLIDRLTPGGTVPSGECPECGALCYTLELGDV